MRNFSYENEFCMQFHFHANQSHFHKNGFALRLALKQRHKRTRKWPIVVPVSFNWRQLIPYCFIKEKVIGSSLVLPEEDEEHIKNCPARYSI